MTRDEPRQRGADQVTVKRDHAFRRLRFVLLRTLLRAAPSERQRVLILTVIVGVASGLVAVAFHLLLRQAEKLFHSATFPPTGQSAVLVVLIPTLGGLLCGALLQYIVPEARGSGIPQVKAAYATPGGRVTARTAVGKFFVSLIQIGSGASLGREGPTVQICAGIASAIGKMGALSRNARRRMLPVGAAAGVAAAFNAPIAAVTFAIEEIVGDLDQAVLSGVVIAAAVAAAIERSILGSHPVFMISGEYTLEHSGSLLLYALLGVSAAVVSIIFTDSLLALRAGFSRARALPAWTRPAVGGLVTGICALLAWKWVGAVGVTGGGYETLGEALTGQLGLKIVFALLLFKLVATVFSYSSGGAGGIFAPSLFIGAMLGSAFGHLDRYIFDRVTEDLGAFALVGMGAAFAGIVRAPITSVLIIFEMTDGYGLILPLMIANMTAYVIARSWRPVSIYEALLQQDGVVLPKRGSGNPLSGVAVEAVMTTTVISVRPDSSVSSAVELLEPHQYAIFPVLDESGCFIGFVNRYRLEKAVEDGEGAKLVREFSTDVEAVFPDTTVPRAAQKLHELRSHMIPVVDPGEPRKFRGLLTSSDVVRAHASLMGEKG